ncbi:hypothetical protein [Yunchengibacter salinarum]|uniref:hypothetical protein n=1 Tax=Yunchengibacter salinarum TaxID=3133399 RepID=UPI0035B585E3
MTPLFLIGRQRSGTSALREAIKHHGPFRCDGETLNSKVCDKALNFYCFLDRQSSGAVARPHQRMDQFSAFLRHVYDDVLPRDHDLLVDLKYDQSNGLDANWNLPDRPPRIIARLVAENWPVIHLVRRNKLAQIVSFEKARKTDQWALRTGKARADARVWLNPDTLIYRIETEMARNQAFADFLANHDRIVTLTYEDLFLPGSNRVAEPAVDAIDALLPADRRLHRPVETWLVKQARDFMADIVNEAEVRSVLEASPHAWMIPNDTMAERAARV